VKREFSDHGTIEAVVVVAVADSEGEEAEGEGISILIPTITAGEAMIILTAFVGEGILLENMADAPWVEDEDAARVSLGKDREMVVTTPDGNLWK